MKRPQGKGGKKEPASKTGETSDDHDDDHHIWSLAAETIEPLKRRKPRFHPAAEAAKSAPVKKVPSATPIAKTTRLEAKLAPPAALASSPKAAPRPAPELAAFDRNSARKIRIGRVEIEARVDLHGMHQHEAHAALRSFLARCQSRGLRFVLVITGKGKATSSASFDDEGRERGVLKRNVPRWLEEPDVRSIVVSYMTAAIQHGGEGAIYVHLWTKERP